MARPAKVWHRADIGWWMVTIGGVKTRLVQGPNDAKHRELAEERFVDLRKLKRTAPQAATARTFDVIEAFLRWSRQHLSADTHRVNRYYAQLFAEHCGTVPARELKPYHVTEWLTTMTSPERVERENARRAEELAAGKVEKHKQGRAPKVWGESTCHNARTTAFRVFSWAKDEGMLAENPLAGMKRPQPPSRQRAMTEEEFEKIHANASGVFADFLLALRETGARPKEVRDLLWSEVKEDRWVIERHKTSKKTKKARVVMLTDTMKAMMDRLRGNGHENVFLNCEGGPWTMNAVRLQMTRLRKNLGLADDLCAYLCRHGFGTRAILNGVSPIVVAHLMGHTSLEMIQRVYVHLADEHEHLKEAVEQINSSSKPVPAGGGQVRKRALSVKPKKSGRKPAAA